MLKSRNKYNTYRAVKCQLTIFSETKKKTNSQTSKRSWMKAKQTVSISLSLQAKLHHWQNVGQLCGPPPFVTFDLTTSSTDSTNQTASPRRCHPYLPSDSSVRQFLLRHRGALESLATFGPAVTYALQPWLTDGFDGNLLRVTAAVVVSFRTRQWNPKTSPLEKGMCLKFAKFSWHC